MISVKIGKATIMFLWLLSCKSYFMERLIGLFVFLKDDKLL